MCLCSLLLIHSFIYFFALFPAHTDRIVGLHMSSVNDFVVSTSKDTLLRAWSFTGKLLLTARLKVPLELSCMSRVNNFVAVAGADRGIRLYDADARRFVRSFGPHDARITDMAWTPDGRWLLSTSIDCSVRVWGLFMDSWLSAFLLHCVLLSLVLFAAFFC